MEQQLLHHHQATGLVQPPPQPPQQQPLHFPPSTIGVNPNPNPNPNPVPTHPSYTEMITAAILWDSSQGKAGGSSKRAIAKYIDRVYSNNLPPTHSALLTHHLKRLKNTGQLVMIKNSYQLPILAATASVTATANANTVNANGVSVGGVVPVRSIPGNLPSGAKKRPGRPPKVQAQVQGQVQGDVKSENSVVVGKKRPRGRPARSEKQQVPFVQAQMSTTIPELGLNNGPPVKRRPGRPSKKQAALAVQPVRVEPQFRPQGTTTYVVGPGNGVVQKKRPGRPPKLASPVPVNVVPANAVPANVVHVAGGEVKPKGRGRGRPKRNALGLAVKPVGKKPRGRPLRQPGVVTPVVGGKRRGRPAKGSVSVVPQHAKPVRAYTGKPRGRPKKSAATPAKPTHEQRMADEELIKKVENMQSKVKVAVSVLKPYFTNENATDALAALQQLEDVSTMDITAASLNPPVEPPVTDMLLNNATIEPCTDVSLQETMIAPVSTVPAPQADPLPHVMPFNISAPTMTDTAPFYMPTNIGTQQPTSWIPSGEAQLRGS